MTMKIKYRVKLHNDFDAPYWKNDDLSKMAKHLSIDEYITYDEDVFNDILVDFIDAPKKKLTSEDVQKDFGENRTTKISEKCIDAIKAYYNGRFELKKRVDSMLKKINIDKIDEATPVMMKFNIPFELNHFSCEDDDLYDKLTKQLEAYIEIEISRVK